MTQLVAADDSSPSLVSSNNTRYGASVMRQLVHIVAGVALLVCVGDLTRAQEAAPVTEAPRTEAPAPAPTAPAAATGGTDATPTQTRPLRRLVPPTRPKEIEKLERRRPSGFWTSTRPAKGGAYRYRLLAIGVGLLLLTLAGMVWLVRRHTRDAAGVPPAEPAA